MSREVKIRATRTREGPDYRIALYDDRGRFVLTARVFEFGEPVTLAIAQYLNNGTLGAFAETAIRRAPGA